MADTPAEDDPRVQLGVRIPKSLRDQIDARRAQLPDPIRTGKPMSRDRWVANAVRFALAQPPRQQPPLRSAPRKRTAPNRRTT